MLFINAGSSKYLTANREEAHNNAYATLLYSYVNQSLPRPSTQVMTGFRILLSHSQI